MKTIIVSLSLPEYKIDAPPDFHAIGAKIDKALEDHFAGRDVALRAVSLAEHSHLTLDELVNAILQAGTDRYDPNRKSAENEDFAPYQIDLHAGACTIGKDHFGEGADSVKKFYENMLLARGYRLRVDVILVFDLHQLVRAEKVDRDKPGVDPRLEPYLFRVKNPQDKQGALLGIVKLLKFRAHTP